MPQVGPAGVGIPAVSTRGLSPPSSRGLASGLPGGLATKLVAEGVDPTGGLDGGVVASSGVIP